MWETGNLGTYHKVQLLRPAGESRELRITLDDQGFLAEPDDGSEIGHSGDFVCDWLYDQDWIESVKATAAGTAVVVTLKRDQGKGLVWEFGTPESARIDDMYNKGASTPEPADGMEPPPPAEALGVANDGHSHDGPPPLEDLPPDEPPPPQEPPRPRPVSGVMPGGYAG